MTAHHLPVRSRPGRRGLTLLEVVVATAILGILLAGMTSAVFLASRAVPDGKRGASGLLSTGRATEMIAADLFYAASLPVNPQSADITFTVADRTGDGTAETIRYLWSGPGTPLYREVNGARAAVLENVQEFQLACEKRKVKLPTTYAEGSEVLLASYDQANFLAHIPINDNSWRAQYFKPVLPAEATSWRVTRVRFRARAAGDPKEEIRIQLRPASGVLPTGSILAQGSVMESVLSPLACQWVDVPFSGSSPLDPAAGLCIVFRGVAGADACYLCVDQMAPVAPRLQYVISSDGGANWLPLDNHQARFYVYGTVSSPNPDAYQYRLTSVRCTLRGEDAGSRIQTTIRVVNEPEVGP